VKKICYNSGDIEFFPGDWFLLAHPVYVKMQGGEKVDASFFFLCKYAVQHITDKPHDAFRVQFRSPNMVPFDMLGMASY